MLARSYIYNINITEEHIGVNSGQGKYLKINLKNFVK